MPNLREFAKKFLTQKSSDAQQPIPGSAGSGSASPDVDDWVQVDDARERPSDLVAEEDQDWVVVDGPEDREVRRDNLLTVKAEQDLQKKIALCQAFLNCHGDRGRESAEVEDILAQARKSWGVEQAKKAYAAQMQGTASPEYNPGNRFDPRNLDEKALIMSDLTDHTGSGLTEAEVLAIRTYTASNYQYINPAVANQKDKAGMSDAWMESQNPHDPSKGQTAKAHRKSLHEEGALHAGMMMEAFKKLPKKSGLLYRGARMNQARFDREYAVGKEIVYEAFVSSAVAAHVARQFANGQSDLKLPADATISVFVEADILDARDIMALSVYGATEQEWLVPPGTKLIVESIEDDTVQEDGEPPAATAWKKVYLKQVL